MTTPQAIEILRIYENWNPNLCGGSEVETALLDARRLLLLKATQFLAEGLPAPGIARPRAE